MAELEKIKETEEFGYMEKATKINDVVLIYFEETPLIFARIEDITADHKPGWFHVKLLLLKLPLEPVTWILRDIYINGETFTMNGNKMRLEQVVCPDEADSGDDSDDSSLIENEENEDRSVAQKQGNVISFKPKMINSKDDGE